MKRISIIVAIALAAVAAFAQYSPKPAYCKYKIVGHRGGTKEAGADIPDNSIAALQ